MLATLYSYACYIFLQICNFFLFVLGTAIVGVAVYIWMEVGLLNTFILAIGIIGLFIFMTAGLGYCCTLRSQFCTSLYITYLCITLVLVGVIGYFLLFKERSLFALLNTHFTDSGDTIIMVQNIFDKNFKIARIIIFTALGVIVRSYFLL